MIKTVKFTSLNGEKYKVNLGEEGSGLWMRTVKNLGDRRARNVYEVHIEYDDNGYGDYTKVSSQTFRRLFMAHEKLLLPQVLEDRAEYSWFSPRTPEYLFRSVAYGTVPALGGDLRHVKSKLKSLPLWVKGRERWAK